MKYLRPRGDLLCFLCFFERERDRFRWRDLERDLDLCLWRRDDGLSSTGGATFFDVNNRSTAREASVGDGIEVAGVADRDLTNNWAETPGVVERDDAARTECCSAGAGEFAAQFIGKSNGEFIELKNSKATYDEIVRFTNGATLADTLIEHGQQALKILQHFIFFTSSTTSTRWRNSNVQKKWMTWIFSSSQKGKTADNPSFRYKTIIH